MNVIQFLLPELGVTSLVDREDGQKPDAQVCIKFSFYFFTSSLLGTRQYFLLTLRILYFTRRGESEIKK